MPGMGWTPPVFTASCFGQVSRYTLFCGFRPQSPPPCYLERPVPFMWSNKVSKIPLATFNFNQNTIGQNFYIRFAKIKKLGTRKNISSVFQKYSFLRVMHIWRKIHYRKNKQNTVWKLEQRFFLNFRHTIFVCRIIYKICFWNTLS